MNMETRMSKRVGMCDIVQILKNVTQDYVTIMTE